MDQVDGHQRSARARAARGVEGTRKRKRDRHVAVAHVLSNVRRYGAKLSMYLYHFDPVSVLEGLEVLGYGRHVSRLKRPRGEASRGTRTKPTNETDETDETHKMNVNKKV